MNKLTSRVLLSGVAAAAIFAPAAVNAQGAPPASSANAAAAGAAPEIVVTAQRRSESLQDVPMSVDVATGETLERLNILDFKDVQQLAPGLQLTNDTGRNNAATLRGVTFNPDSGTLPAVEVYFNEVPVDAQTSFTSIYDVAQIEVLRGPQGIFRGRTTPAGSITLSTRKPNLNEPEGYLQGTVTNRHAVNVQGGASVPLIPGVLAVRAAGLIDFNRSNYVRNASNGRRSRGDTESARISLAFSPSEDFDAVLMYQYLASDVSPHIAVIGTGNASPDPASPGVPSGPVAGVKDRIAVSDGVPRFLNRTHLITLAADWRLEGVTLSFNGGYQDAVLKQRRDLDTTNAVPGIAIVQNVRTPYKVVTADLRLASDSDGMFNWVVGGFYQKQTGPVLVTQDNYTFIRAVVPPFGFPVNLNVVSDVLVRVPVDTGSLAGFATARLQFTDRLKLEGGLRYTHYYTKQQSFLTVTDATGTPVGGFGACINRPTVNGLDDCPTISPGNSKRSYNYLTGGLNLVFEATPDLTTYISYGRSYRPGPAGVGITVPLDDNLVVAKSETSDSFEVGVKASLLNRRLNVNLAAFYQKYKNYIDHLDAVNTSSGANGVVDSNGGSPLNTNGDAVAKGIEAQISARLGRNLDLGVSASYVDAHYTDAQLYCNVFNAAGLAVIPVGQQVATCESNDRLAQIPKFSLSANGEYRMNVGDYQPFIRSLVSHRPGFTSKLDNFRYRAFTNLSLFVGLRGPDDRWEISAFSKNLLNQARVSRAGQAEGQFPVFNIGLPNAVDALRSGYRTAVITTPREFGVSAKINW